jgi:hypothetical protein
MRRRFTPVSEACLVEGTRTCQMLNLAAAVPFKLCGCSFIKNGVQAGGVDPWLVPCAISFAVICGFVREYHLCHISRALSVLVLLGT